MLRSNRPIIAKNPDIYILESAKFNTENELPLITITELTSKHHLIASKTDISGKFNYSYLIRTSFMNDFANKLIDSSYATTSSLTSQNARDEYVNCSSIRECINRFDEYIFKTITPRSVSPVVYENKLHEILSKNPDFARSNCFVLLFECVADKIINGEIKSNISNFYKSTTLLALKKMIGFSIKTENSSILRNMEKFNELSSYVKDNQSSEIYRLINDRLAQIESPTVFRMLKRILPRSLTTTSIATNNTNPQQQRLNGTLHNKNANNTAISFTI